MFITLFLDSFMYSALALCLNSLLGFAKQEIACEQALLFRGAKRAAPPSRVHFSPQIEMESLHAG